MAPDAEFLFLIECVSCQRRLGVRSEAAIGAILTCPKCGSMVHVVPPPGWSPRPPADLPQVPSQADGEPVSIPAQARVGEASAGGPHGLVVPAPVAGPPPVACPGPDICSAAGEVGRRAALARWLGYGISKWLVLGALAVASIGATVGMLLVISRPSQHVGQESLADSPAPPITAAESSREDSSPEVGSQPWLRRWLPSRTALVFGLRWPETPEAAELQVLIDAVDPLWRRSVARLLESLRLSPRNVAALTWAAVDLSRWEDRAVVLIELHPGQDAAGLLALGEPFGLELAGRACRRMPQAPWSHPFGALDQRTVLTGPEDLLRELADRAEPRLASAPMDRLLRSTVLPCRGWVLVDLNAGREAGWRWPVWVWDMWPAVREPWRVLWEVPDGFGVWVGSAAPGRCEAAWVGSGETATLKIHGALEQLLPAAKAALDAQTATLTQRLRSGQITPQQVDAYEVALRLGRTALDTARCEIDDQMAYLRIDWGPDWSVWSAAALRSRKTVLSVWLETARAADQANHHRIAVSLSGFAKAEGHFPAGAASGTLLPPETRLSWLATMLPYLEHRDWHRELQFGYSWNSPQNRPVTQRRLEPVVNPALGPSATEAGFPVTHYVGVAGVGPDAAELHEDDPRAGLFGYARTRRLDQLPDGSSHVLATLGVSGRLGPWAAGGEATVRGLTQRPYFEGPDGFGSGQPDAMLGSMADGSVRFFSKNTDPEVLEQLATIGSSRSHAPLATKPKPVAPVAATVVPKVADGTTGDPAKLPKSATVSAADEDDLDNLPMLEERPAQIDLSARLADRIPEIHVPGVPLLSAVRLMSRMSTVPVSFDLDWMQAKGVGLRDPITVRLTGATTHEVLQAAVGARGLVCEVVADQVLVTVPQKHRRTLQTDKHPAADLVGTDPLAPGTLCERIETLVAPDSWKRAGGRGATEWSAGYVIVTQNELVQWQVREFCDRLRLARGIPPLHRTRGPALTLATRFDQARPKLRQPLTATFPDPTPLAQIAAELEQQTRITIVFDGLALHEAGISVDRPSTLAVHQQPLSEALMAWLHPHGLMYRIVDGDTFEVTTRKAASARLELEFYPVAHLLARGMTPDTLMERIKAQLAGATWNDAGGPGQMVFDAPSKHLIVLQSQPVQARLQLLLEKLAAP